MPSVHWDVTLSLISSQVKVTGTPLHTGQILCPSEWETLKLPYHKGRTCVRACACVWRLRALTPGTQPPFQDSQLWECPTLDPGPRTTTSSSPATQFIKEPGHFDIRVNLTSIGTLSKVPKFSLPLDVIF